MQSYTYQGTLEGLLFCFNYGVHICTASGVSKSTLGIIGSSREMVIAEWNG
jgi:hypothetical protein